MRKYLISIVLFWGALALSCGVCAAGPVVAAAAEADLADVAKSVESSGELRLQGLHLRTQGPEAELRLQRFEVFAPDADIEVHGASGDTHHQPPANAYFRGHVVDRPESVAVLSVHAAGDIRGIIADRGRYWVLGAGEAAGAPGLPLVVREIDAGSEFAVQAANFSCGAGQLYGKSPQGLVSETFAKLQSGIERAQTRSPASYTARVAVETDHEYYALFNDITDATNYIGDLFAFGSTIYDAEVDTTLMVSSVSLWTGADPWVNDPDTICGLLDFGRYWNNNNTGIERTIAHFLSGRNLGGGVAWVGVLCSSPFTTSQSHVNASCPSLPSSSNFGGHYGFSASISGSFNINSPSVVWDIVVVAHEIGHNFGSRHTHCYANIGGNPNPVDGCNNGQSGCYSGTAMLPGVGSLSGGTPGAGNGTIMSYCHLLSAGMSNITLTFGQSHIYGVAASRVPTVMHDEVLATAAGNPSCLALVSTALFADGFESGNTSTWSATVP